MAHVICKSIYVIAIGFVFAVSCDGVLPKPNDATLLGRQELGRLGMVDPLDAFDPNDVIIMGSHVEDEPPRKKKKTKPPKGSGEKVKPQDRTASEQLSAFSSQSAIALERGSVSEKESGDLLVSNLCDELDAVDQRLIFPLMNSNSTALFYHTPLTRTVHEIGDELRSKICPDLQLDLTSPTCRNIMWYIVQNFERLQITQMLCKSEQGKEKFGRTQSLTQREIEDLSPGDKAAWGALRSLRSLEKIVVDLLKIDRSTYNNVKRTMADLTTDDVESRVTSRDTTDGFVKISSAKRPVICPFKQKEFHSESDYFRDQRRLTYREIQALPSSYPGSGQAKSLPSFQYTAIVTFYRRPHTVYRMLRSLFNQNHPPTEVWVVAWASPFEDEILSEVSRFKKTDGYLNAVKVVHGDVNLKYYGRFQVGLQAQTKYIAFLDDDCIPGKRFFEGALHAINTKEFRGLLGSIGSSLPMPTTALQTNLPDPQRCLPWFCLGSYWYSPTHFTTLTDPSVLLPTVATSREVDHLGGMWFGETKWLKVIFREEVVSWATAEDMTFCYSVKKFAGVPCYLLPGDIHDADTWGYPEDYDAISGHGGGARDIPMNIHRQEISHKLLQRGYERSTSSDYHTLPHVVYFADNAAQARHLSTIINHIASRIEAIARESGDKGPNEVLGFQNHYVITGRGISREDELSLAETFGAEAASLYNEQIRRVGWFNLQVGTHTARAPGMVGADMGEIMESFKQIVNSLRPVVVVLSTATPERQGQGGKTEDSCAHCLLAAALTASDANVSVLLVDNEAAGHDKSPQSDLYLRLLQETASWKSASLRNSGDIVISSLGLRVLSCGMNPSLLNTQRNHLSEAMKEELVPVSKLAFIVDDPKCLNRRALINGHANIFGSYSDSKTGTVLLRMLSWLSMGNGNGIVQNAQFERVTGSTSFSLSMEEFKAEWCKMDPSSVSDKGVIQAVRSHLASDPFCAKRADNVEIQTSGSLDSHSRREALSSTGTYGHDLASLLLDGDEVVPEEKRAWSSFGFLSKATPSRDNEDRSMELWTTWTRLYEMVVRSAEVKSYFPFLLASNLNSTNVFVFGPSGEGRTVIRSLNEVFIRDPKFTNKNDNPFRTHIEGQSKVYVPNDDSDSLSGFPKHYFDIYLSSSWLQVGQEKSPQELDSLSYKQFVDEVTHAVKPGGFLITSLRLSKDSSSQRTLELLVDDLTTEGFVPLEMDETEGSGSRFSKWNKLQGENRNVFNADALDSTSKGFQEFVRRRKGATAGIDSDVGKTHALVTLVMRRCTKE